jgi:hypothetical protein
VSSTESVRIEISFDGGQTVSLVVSGVDADSLEQALEGGREDALALDAEGGRYTIALRRIVYVKRFGRESRVGFGSGV